MPEKREPLQVSVKLPCGHTIKGVVSGGGLIDASGRCQECEAERLEQMVKGIYGDLMAYSHREAYCLMWYECKECGHREQFWNSRDGVTPFGVHGKCPNCPDSDMLHGDFNLDQRDPDHVPQPGQGVFVTMPAELVPVFARRNYQWHSQTSDIAAQLTMDEFVASFINSTQPGAPWLIRWPEERKSL